MQGSFWIAIMRMQIFLFRIFLSARWNKRWRMIRNCKHEEWIQVRLPRIFYGDVSKKIDYIDVSICKHCHWNGNEP